MLSKPAVRKELESLEKRFVMAPAYKASNNVICIYKQSYMDQVIHELHMYDNNNDGSAYRLVHDISNEEIVRQQSSFCDL